MVERRRLEQVTAADLAPLERVLDPEYPERLRDMCTVIFLALQDHGQDTPAAELALALTEAVSLELGGGSFYMHKGFVFRQGLTKRDREIAEQARSNNLHILARRHGITEMRVRQIVDAYRQEQFLARQGQLPGMPERETAKPGKK